MTTSRRVLSGLSLFLILVAAGSLRAPVGVAAEQGEALVVSAAGAPADRFDTWRWLQFQSRLTGQPVRQSLFRAEPIRPLPLARRMRQVSRTTTRAII